MTQPDISDSARRAMEVRELEEWETNVYVLSVVDDDGDESGGVVHAVYDNAADAVNHAHECHLCLMTGEKLLIEGFVLGAHMDPTTVTIRRPDLVSHPDVIIEGE